jgi:hypothetical protein
MAAIKLYDDELADGRVPARCLVCGREADFHSVNLFNGPMVLTVPLGTVYALKRWGKPRADMGGGVGFFGGPLARVPLCPSHRGHFRSFSLFGLAAAPVLILAASVGFFALFIAAIVVAAYVGAAGFLLWPVGLVALFVTLAVAALLVFGAQQLLWFRTTYATHLGDNYFDVRNAAPDFVAALEAMRRDAAAQPPVLCEHRPEPYEDRHDDYGHDDERPPEREYDDYSRRWDGGARRPLDPDEERRRSDEEFERRFPRQPRPQSDDEETS